MRNTVRSTPVIILICSIVLLSCSPAPSLEGDIEEQGDYPIAGRLIVPCSLGIEKFEEGQKVQTRLECTLIDNIAVSDKDGHFSLTGLEEGLYLLFYDSGKADFEVAVEKWAGQTLKIGDHDWVTHEFMGSEDDSLEVQIINEMLPFIVAGKENALMNYVRLHLIYSDSPFILAHDIDEIVEDSQLAIIIARVGKDAVPVSFGAIYLKVNG